MERSAQDIFNTANTQRTPEEWSNYYASDRNQPIPELKFDLKEGIQLPPFAGLPQVTAPDTEEDVATNEQGEGSVGVNGPDGAVGEPGIPEVTDINALVGALAVINTVENANLGGASIPQFGGDRSPDLARPAFDNGASQGDVSTSMPAIDFGGASIPQFGGDRSPSFVNTSFDSGTSQSNPVINDQYNNRLMPLSQMSSKIPVATIPQLNPNFANEWDATSAMEGYRPNPDMTGYKPYDYSNTLMPIGVLKSQGQR